MEILRVRGTDGIGMLWTVACGRSYTVILPQQRRSSKFFTHSRLHRHGQKWAFSYFRPMQAPAWPDATLDAGAEVRCDHKWKHSRGYHQSFSLLYPITTANTEDVNSRIPHLLAR